jgi:cell division septation protein DedD
MTEHRPREIQLTSKQLVFVFMSTVLVAVVVFLLGVWVGRGIDVGSMAATGEVTDVLTQKSPQADPAAGRASSKGGYDYPKMLQDQGGGTGAPASGSAPAGPPAEEQPPAPTPAPPPLPALAPPTATQDRTQSPPPKPAPPPDPPAKALPADGDTWVIQAGAFSNKAGAEKVAADFRGKGYPVTVTPGPTFKVWIGSYPKKAAADQVAARLRKEWPDLRVIRPR